MPTDFPAYTRAELDQRARSIIRFTQFNDRGVRDADVSPGSDYDVMARVIGAVADLLQKASESSLRVINPRQSFGDFARQFGSIFGIGSKLTETSQAAIKATGYAIARSSTGSQAIAATTQLAHADGSIFTVDSTGSTSATAAKTFSVGYRSRRGMIFMGATTAASVAAAEVYELVTGELCAVRGAWTTLVSGNSYRWVQLENDLDVDPELGQLFTQRFGRVVPITAAVAGRAGNKEAKDVLTFVAPPGTVQASATIVRLTGGRDALTVAQIQSGIRSLYGTRLETLTLADIRTLALATPGLNLRDVYVVPAGGAIGGASDFGGYRLMATGPEYGLVSAADRTAIAAYVAANASPVEKWVVPETLQVQASLDVTLKVSPEFAPDWAPTISTAIMATGVSTTTRVQFTSSLATYAPFAVGQRVLLSMARGASANEDPCLIQRRISALGANYFDVDAADPLPYAPTSVCVSPGGPFADGLIAASEAYIDQQAPFTSLYRHPAPTSETSVAAYQGALASVAGVTDVVVTAGAYSLTEGYILIPNPVAVRVWS